MARETRFTGTSLTSFTDAARSAFDRVPGDPGREGLKDAEVVRAWMTGGGIVGVPQYHVELGVREPAPPDVAATAARPPENRLSCDDWTAYHDFMPGRTPTLRVHGRCTAPTAGFRLTLVREAPQGINPRDLLLRLEVEEPEVAAEVITEHEVTYEEATAEPYDTVTILPDGPTVKVEIVS